MPPSWVCTSPFAVNTTVGVQDLVTVPISSELKSFLLIMCTDAPESSTNSRSSGLFEVIRCRHYLCFTRNFERSFVRILELVNVFRQIPRCFAGASFLVQGLLM